MAHRLTLNKVHEYRKQPGNPVAVLVHSNPYVRLNHEGGPPVFVQKGQFFSEGGQVLTEETLPPWFKTELEKINQAVRVEVGLEAPMPAGGKSFSTQLQEHGIDPELVDLMKDPEVAETLKKLAAIKEGRSPSSEEVDGPGDLEDPGSLDYDPDREAEEPQPEGQDDVSHDEDPELAAALRVAAGEGAPPEKPRRSRRGRSKKKE